jgi:signal transduction histidine kinase
VRLSLAELARRARDGATPLAVARYGPPDVPSDETLGTWDPPALRLRDGRLVFTMTSGLAVVDRSGPAAAPLPVRIEEVLAGDRPAAPPLGGPLSLPAGGGPLELRFTAPAFAAPGRVRFFHALEGVDAGWVAAEGRRTARYTGLAPGTYTFRVRAESDDGARAPGEAAITLHLPPRWWQTLPFRALLVAATFGLAALAFRLREARARARFGLVLDERRRIARELHDSLAQVFTGLALQLDALARGAALPEGLRDRLDRLRATVTEGRRAARTAIWNLRADTGSSRALERALEELARQYEGANVAVTVEGTAAPLPLAAENELLLVAHQAVSNAVEHARARHIGVTLEYAPGRVALWVRDDGAGFAAAEAEGAEARGHFGLLGMRERAARAGGRLVVESSPGVGTEVGVVIDAREPPAEEAP